MHNIDNMSPFLFGSRCIICGLPARGIHMSCTNKKVDSSTISFLQGLREGVQESTKGTAEERTKALEEIDKEIEKLLYPEKNDNDLFIDYYNGWAKKALFSFGFLSGIPCGLMSESFFWRAFNGYLAAMTKIHNWLGMEDVAEVFSQKEMMQEVVRAMIRIMADSDFPFHEGLMAGGRLRRFI